MPSTLGIEYIFRKGLKSDVVSDEPLLLKEEKGNTQKPGKVRGAYEKWQRADRFYK